MGENCTIVLRVWQTSFLGHMTQGTSVFENNIMNKEFNK